MTSDDKESAAGEAGAWLSAVRDLIDAIERTQMPAIAEASERSAACIAAGGLVHLFGTGHSRIPLEEMFPRYGSYPGFNPMAELSMTFHTQVVGSNGQRQAMFIERTEGLAEVILDNYHFAENDLMVVFSAGGRTAVPIEMAIGARQRGLFVIAVTSLASANAAPSEHSSGTRLHDHADLVIDLCTPAGDALVTLDGADTPIGPGSTIANTVVVSELKVQTAARLLEAGALPPVITSSTVVGTDRAATLFAAAYDEHGRRISRRLTPEPGPTEADRVAGASGPSATEQHEEPDLA